MDYSTERNVDLSRPVICDRGFFTLNEGQIPYADVVFHTDFAYFTSKGVILKASSKSDAAHVKPSSLAIVSNGEWSPLTCQADTAGLEAQKMVIFCVTFLDALDTRPVGCGEPAFSTSFFLGNDSSKWVSDTPSYKRIRYPQLYDGIDLDYYFTEQGLKYEFRVAPGADIERIQMRYDGAGVSVEGASLKLKIQLGGIEDKGLVFLQETDTGLVQVRGRAVVRDNIVRYIADYNKTKTLIIDPLIFSSLIGGQFEDAATTMALDSSSNVYVAGYTYSPDFPTTVGVYDTDLSGRTDSFIVKLDPAGSKILKATYIGGRDDESDSGFNWHHSIVIDRADNIYLSGSTTSPDYPVTAGAFNTTFQTGLIIVVTKLDSNLSRLIFSTFIGDGRNSGMAIDSSCNVYLTGWTDYPTLPITPGAFCSTFIHYAESYAIKLDVTGSKLIYCTYLSGSADDMACGIEVNDKGEAVVTGTTSSHDFPVTPGAFDTTFYEGGNYQAFILQLSNDGSKLLFSTFIGGSGKGLSVDLDKSGNVYALIISTSSDFPFTEGAFCTSKKNTGFCCVKLDSSGSKLIYSTFTGESRGLGSIFVNSDSTILVTGTAHANFPVTRGAFDTNYSEQKGDAFILKLNNNGSGLDYSSYLGNSSKGLAVVSKDPGIAYIAGMTDDVNFPTTPGAFNSTGAIGYIAFVMELQLTAAPSEPLWPAARAGDRYVQLNWTSPQYCGTAPITNYTIYRGLREDALAPFLTIGNLTAYNDTGLQNSVTYYYAVTSQTRHGVSGKSAIVFTTPWAVPTPPRGLNLTAGDGFISLRWLQPSDNGGYKVTSFIVYRGTDKDNMIRFLTLGNLTEYMDVDVVNGVRYYYAISAVNIKGEGNRCDPASAMPGFPPTAPLGLTAIANGAGIDLSWQPPASNGGVAITSYSVYRGSRLGEEVFLATVNFPYATYSDGPIRNGSKLVYYVTATNVIGESPASNEAVVTPNGAPGAPINFTAAQSGWTLSLRWQPPLSDGGAKVLKYNIYRGISPEREMYLCNVTGDQMAHLDAAVEHGLAYSYLVSAENVVGEGPPGVAASVLTDFLAPRLQILRPVNGSYLNNPDVEVALSALDDSGVGLLEISSDGINWTRCEGSGGMSGRLRLSEGNNTIRARATDLAGNRDISEIEVVVDTIPPSIWIQAPAEGAMLAVKNATIRGNASDSCLLSTVELSLNGGNWTPVNGTASWQAELIFTATRNIIKVRARDAAGNSAFAAINITSDTGMPTVTITDPMAGQALRASSSSLRHVVHGIAADNVRVAKVEVSLDGKNWKVARGTDSWSAELSLSLGTNAIYARATDTAGNTVVTKVDVKIDFELTVAGSSGMITAILVAVGFWIGALMLFRYAAKKRHH